MTLKNGAVTIQIYRIRELPHDLIDELTGIADASEHTSRFRLSNKSVIRQGLTSTKCRYDFATSLYHWLLQRETTPLLPWRPAPSCRPRRPSAAVPAMSPPNGVARARCQVFKKANKSALMISACVVGMPCGNPL
jgi:hypothetical protein